MLINKETLNVIKIFKNVTDTAKFLKTSTSHVSKYCKNNRILKGYLVKYAESNQQETAVEEIEQ